MVKIWNELLAFLAFWYLVGATLIFGVVASKGTLWDSPGFLSERSIYAFYWPLAAALALFFISMSARRHLRRSTIVAEAPSPEMKTALFVGSGLMGCVFPLSVYLLLGIEYEAYRFQLF